MTDPHERPNQAPDHELVWRIDARDQMLLALIEMARAAATIRRRMIVTHTRRLDGEALARIISAGEGYVTCEED